MKRLIEGLEEADRLDVAKSLLAALGFFICAVAAGYGLRTPGMEFVVVPFGLFGLMLLAYAVLYLAYAYGYRPAAHYDDGYDEYPDQEEEEELAEDDSAQDDAQRNIAQLPALTPNVEAAIKVRRCFYDFIYGVCMRNLISENQWASLPDSDALAHITRTHYREFMPYLEQYEIVSKVSKGGTRKTLLNFPEALQAVEANTEKGYWELAGGGHHTQLTMPVRKALSPIPATSQPHG
jgi:hypothetical protein